jgi:predicted ATP-dependent endonuclease of OLD family
MAFLRALGHQQPPILLIDEAESHLHIDAQADLVNMFMTQTQAIKVIYTTHSPACLPPDLGTGIRAVVPRADNLQISDIKNSFWHAGAGYSPLMLAMGAAAAAFTPARCVVLAEGATEMILLPTLIRAAIDQDSLPYQIAPGLSEVPKDIYPRLDLEGAKVAYLLDGDQSGKERAKGLTKAGVPEDLIVSIGANGAENLLEPDAYCEAIKSLVLERPTLSSLPDLPALPGASDESWANIFAAWFETNGIDPPSKVAVANWLVENGKAEPNAAARTLLSQAHTELMRALEQLPTQDQ